LKAESSDAFFPPFNPSPYEKLTFGSFPRDSCWGGGCVDVLRRQLLINVSVLQRNATAKQGAGVA
jgi:hypothetical protein